MSKIYYFIDFWHHFFGRLWRTGMLLSTKLNGDKSNAPYSGFPNYLQTKSNLHISLCQSLHYIKTRLETLQKIDSDIQEPHLIGFLFVSEKTNLGGPLTYGFRRPYKSEEGGPPKVDMAFVIVVVVFTKSGEIIREESNVNQKTSKSFRLAKHCSAWLGLGGVR